MQVKIGDLQEFTSNEITKNKMVLFVEETTCLKYTADVFSNTGITYNPNYYRA